MGREQYRFAREGVTVLSLPGWAKNADRAMVPLMYILQGNFREKPQETHFWNNQKLSCNQHRTLNSSKMLRVKGNPAASKRWLGVLPRFHIPILGGWREFVVVQPDLDDVMWYVGWIVADTSGVSQLPLHGPVRLLVGPLDVVFFGVDAQGRQLQIRNGGRGHIGLADSKQAALPLR